MGCQLGDRVWSEFRGWVEKGTSSFETRLAALLRMTQTVAFVVRPSSFVPGVYPEHSAQHVVEGLGPSRRSFHSLLRMTQQPPRRDDTTTTSPFER